MKISTRRRLAGAAVITASAVVAGVLAAAPASAAITNVTPGIVFQNDPSETITFDTASGMDTTPAPVGQRPTVTFTRLTSDGALTSDTFTTQGTVVDGNTASTTVVATNPGPANDGPAVAGRYRITINQPASVIGQSFSDSCPEVQGCFRIDRVIDPAVTGTSPTGVTIGTSANVTVNGRGFDRATTIRVLKLDGSADPNISATGRPTDANGAAITSGTVTANTIQRRFVVGAAAEEGGRLIEITTGDGIVRLCPAACFTVNPGPLTSLAVLTSAGNESGRSASNANPNLVRVRFKGSALTSGTPSLEYVAASAGSATTATLRRVGTNVSYNGAFLDADFDLRGWAPGVNAYQAFVQKDTTSSQCVNTVDQSQCRLTLVAPAPTLSDVTPNTQQANQTSGQTVTVTGSSLARGVRLEFIQTGQTAVTAAVAVCGSGVTPATNSDGSIDTTRFTAQVCTASNAPQSTYTARVTNTDGQSAEKANAYTVSGTASASPSPSSSSTGTASPTATASGTASPTPTGTDTNGRYVALDTPTRVLDSRPAPDNKGTSPAKKLGTVPVDLSGVLGGTSAQSVVLNLTVVAPDGSGNAVVHAQGATIPGTSNINFIKGQIQANQVITLINQGNKQAAVTVRGSATHVIVDMVGYFTAANVTGSARTVLQTPRRVAGANDATNIADGGVLSLTLSAQDVPAGSTSAILNVTVTRASQPSGFVVAYPGGTNQPATSNVNFTRLDNQGKVAVQANEVIVRMGTGADANKINLKISRGTARVIVDVIGGLVTGNGDVYTGLTPDRFVDSRPGSANEGTTASRKTGVVMLTLPSSVPATATGVVLNVTAVDAEAGNSGFIVAYPAGTTKPATSNVNWRAGSTQANEVIVRIGSNRQVVLEVDGAREGTGTHIVVDLVGYVSGTGAASTATPTATSTATGSPSPSATTSATPSATTSATTSPSATGTRAP